jgi:hypothetical protein
MGMSQDAQVPLELLPTTDTLEPAAVNVKALTLTMIVPVGQTTLTLIPPEETQAEWLT